MKKQTSNLLYDMHGSERKRGLDKQKDKETLVKTVKVILLIFLILMIGKFIFSIPGFLHRLGDPFASLTGEVTNERKLDLDFRTNILVGSIEENKFSDFGLISVSKKDKSLEVLILNPAAKVFYKGQTQSFNELFNSEKNIDSVAFAMMQNLGVAVDGYLLVGNGQEWVSEEKIRAQVADLYSPSFFINIFSTKNYLNQHLKTNYSLGNVFALANAANNVKKDSFNFYDFTENINADQSLSTETIKSELGLSLVDNQLASEDLTVEVVNATSVPGLGQTIKNVVTNLGGNVLQVSSGEVQEKTEIITADKKSKLSTRLGEILKAEIREQPSQGSVDIKVIIGEDFGKHFSN